MANLSPNDAKKPVKKVGLVLGNLPPKQEGFGQASVSRTGCSSLSSPRVDSKRKGPDDYLNLPHGDGVLKCLPVVEIPLLLLSSVLYSARWVGPSASPS